MLLDNNNRKPIIRLNLNGKSVKFVTTFEQGKEVGVRRDIASVVDIYKVATRQIRQTIKRYESGGVLSESGPAEPLNALRLEGAAGSQRRGSRVRRTRRTTARRVSPAELVAGRGRVSTSRFGLHDRVRAAHARAALGALRFVCGMRCLAGRRARLAVAAPRPARERRSAAAQLDQRRVRPHAL